MANNPLSSISIEVVYALPHRQYYYHLTMPTISTVQQAIEKTNLTALRPELDLSQCRVGIYSQAVSLTTPLTQGDRVEIYRPITADPKELRQRRLQKKAANQ